MKTKVFRPIKKETNEVYTIIWEPNGPRRITQTTILYTDGSYSERYEWSSEDDLKYIKNWERYPAKYSHEEALAAAMLEWKKAESLIGKTVVTRGNGFQFIY